MPCSFDMNTSDAILQKTEPRAARLRARSSFFNQGECMVWLTGSALVVALCMIAGLLGLIVVQGALTLWPGAVDRYTLSDGSSWMGEATRRESTPHGERVLVRIGNFELTGAHFKWMDLQDVKAQERPEWGILLERREWGRFYGMPEQFELDGRSVATSASDVWRLFQEHHPGVLRRWEQIRRLETREVGRINSRLEKARLRVRQAEMKYGTESQEALAATQSRQKIEQDMRTELDTLQQEIAALRVANRQYAMVLKTADGQAKRLALADVVRAFPANRLTLAGRARIYASRWAELLTAPPREANSEGGIFPAIFGTLVMTLFMSLAVVPFGVMAALYLREYARSGPAVSIIRISINNLAGVPSIVFGVFGLGFFCYLLGGSLDQAFFQARLPNPTFGKGGILWASLTLALMTLPVVIVATEEALSAVPNSMREGSFACGASQWQTIRRIILPRALPGILTGMILAMARGAGEVAPLMLVGAVKLAPELPVDGVAPFIHPERSFMHLGFHLFDLGFQSQNSEAAKPMVFTTTLVLIGLILVLNLVAVRLRTRIQRKVAAHVF